MPSAVSERICWQPPTQLTAIFLSLAIFFGLNVNCVMCIVWSVVANTHNDPIWMACKFSRRRVDCATHFRFIYCHFVCFCSFFSSSVTWGAYYFIRSFYFLLQFCRNNNYSVVEWVQKEKEVIIKIMAKQPVWRSTIFQSLLRPPN